MNLASSSFEYCIELENWWTLFHSIYLTVIANQHPECIIDHHALTSTVSGIKRCNASSKVLIRNELSDCQSYIRTLLFPNVRWFNIVHDSLIFIIHYYFHCWHYYNSINKEFESPCHFPIIHFTKSTPNK